uniref:Uncharacterized protein n=1 Tax=Anguilla anguilla TaxID=7936 RepID=A0A0E9USX8_ANGAN
MRAVSKYATFVTCFHSTCDPVNVRMCEFLFVFLILGSCLLTFKLCADVGFSVDLMVMASGLLTISRTPRIPLVISALSREI